MLEEAEKHVVHKACDVTVTKMEKKIVEPIVSAAATPVNNEISQSDRELMHKILDNLLDICPKWHMSELSELFVHTEEEYAVITQVRATAKLRVQSTFKDITDAMIAKNNDLFESRNNGKLKNKTKRKSFFGKKS